jgi:hypothetical protein
MLYLGLTHPLSPVFTVWGAGIAAVFASPGYRAPVILGLTTGAVFGFIIEIAAGEGQRAPPWGLTLMMSTFGITIALLGTAFARVSVRGVDSNGNEVDHVIGGSDGSETFAGKLAWRMFCVYVAVWLGSLMWQSIEKQREGLAERRRQAELKEQALQEAGAHLQKMIQEMDAKQAQEQQRAKPPP